MFVNKHVFLNAGWQRLKSALLPSTCILCSVAVERHIDLCAGCENDLPWLNTVCSVCAMPLTLNVSSQPVSCGHCLQQPPAFFTVTALFHYQTPIDKFITGLKFQQQLLYARLFGELLSVRLQQNYQGCDLPELIIPVPLHPKRLQERGFNQALEIARPVAKKLNLPIDIFHCERVRMTAAQSLLPADERQQNIKDAFKIKLPLDVKYVAVMDDVITTGHTVTELCKTLKRVGVQRVDVWSVARTAL